MVTLTVKTDEDLLDRLGDCAKRKLTSNEILQQRISFIYAGMPKKSGMSKIDIEQELTKDSLKVDII